MYEVRSLRTELSYSLLLDGGGCSQTDFHLYICNDDGIRRASSSGGAFTAFAEHILSEGGVVFASRYNFSEERLEVSSTDLHPLEEFRKSKYIESNTLDSFGEIKKRLHSGQKVLFCGTPCQVAGLKQFLAGNDIGLFTIDFFCHGVPANAHFTAFKHALEGTGRKMTGFDFRYRDPLTGTGWHDLVFRAEFDDGTAQILPYEPPYFYSYYKPFEESLILRRSCYGCRAVNSSRADVTLGDFWGVRNYSPQVDDNRGISVVKLHSSQAKERWVKVATTGTTTEIPYDAVAVNYRRHHQTQELSRRDRLAARVAEKGFMRTMKKHYRIERLVRGVRKWMKRAIGR